MPASNHPEYAIETDHLQRTLEAVDQQAQELDYRGRHSSGAENRTTYILRDIIRQQAQPLNHMRVSPYFGRIDVNDQDNAGTETYYIGEYHLDHNGVTIISWQAPIAALFYKSVFGAGSYQSPDGKVHSQLLLKRRLLIENRKLTDIRDELDKRSQPNTI